MSFCYLVAIICSQEVAYNPTISARCHVYSSLLPVGVGYECGLGRGEGEGGPHLDLCGGDSRVRTNSQTSATELGQSGVETRGKGGHQGRSQWNNYAFLRK